jgi:hypothetical protein
LSRGSDSSGEVWIGCKRLILKLSKVLSVKEVKGPYMLELACSKVLSKLRITISILQRTGRTINVSWKSRVLGKGFSSTGVYTALPSRNGFSPNNSVLVTHYSSCL